MRDNACVHIQFFKNLITIRAVISQSDVTLPFEETLDVYVVYMSSVYWDEDMQEKSWILPCEQ